MVMVHSSAQSSSTQNSMGQDIALNTHGLYGEPKHLDQVSYHSFLKVCHTTLCQLFININSFH